MTAVVKYAAIKQCVAWQNKLTSRTIIYHYIFAGIVSTYTNAEVLRPPFMNL
jgi:hypothetical protein